MWIYNPLTLGAPGIRRNALVWRMNVAAQVNGEPVRELVLIDAQIGAIALNFNQLARAKERRVCDFENEADPEGTDNTCTSAEYDRVEGEPPTGVADVDQAYDQHGAVYDYYFENFGRDSIDGGETYQDAGSLFINNGYVGDISPYSDNPLALRHAFVDRSKGYISSRADLASLAGKNVRFRIGTDSTTDDYGWFIDDIRISTPVDRRRSPTRSTRLW